jgi:hypothetical protein
MQKKIYRTPIWHHIPASISFLCSQRKALKRPEKSIRIGLNFSIILNSACFVEGVLEAGLKALLQQRRLVFNKISSIPEFYTRKTINTLFNNIEEELERRISKTTGPSNYDELFKLLIDQKLSEFEKIKPLWESIQVLFQFRNVLAHGKEISAVLVKGPKTQGSWEESFFGGYKKAEEYLVKNKLLKKRYLDRNTEDIFFTDKVADHFKNLARRFIKAISNSLSDNEKSAFDMAVFKGNIFLT